MILLLFLFVKSIFLFSDELRKIFGFLMKSFFKAIAIFTCMFRVFRSEWYESNLKKLDHSEVLIVLKFEQHLKYQSLVGKPLYSSFLREKKFGNKRLLYLIYPQYSAILLVAITDKKAQQGDIHKILCRLEDYHSDLLHLLSRA